MKKWYVIQVYAGYEDQVKADIERFREAAKAFTGIAKELIKLRLMS